MYRSATRADAQNMPAVAKGVRPYALCHSWTVGLTGSTTHNEPQVISSQYIMRPVCAKQ